MGRLPRLGPAVDPAAPLQKAALPPGHHPTAAAVTTAADRGAGRPLVPTGTVVAAADQVHQFDGAAIAHRRAAVRRRGDDVVRRSGVAVFPEAASRPGAAHEQEAGTTAADGGGDSPVNAGCREALVLTGNVAAEKVDSDDTAVLREAAAVGRPVVHRHDIEAGRPADQPDIVVGQTVVHLHDNGAGRPVVQ